MEFIQSSFEMAVTEATHSCVYGSLLVASYRIEKGGVGSMGVSGNRNALGDYTDDALTISSDNTLRRSGHCGLDICAGKA